MARISVQKKGGVRMHWWLLGLLVLASLGWLLIEVLQEDESEVAATEEIAPEQETMQEPLAEAPSVSMGDILNSPENFIGEDFPLTEVNVVEVPTDRGFWGEAQGQRLFALIIDEPDEEPMDIRQGQTLRVDGGTLRDSTFLGEMPGRPLDQTTKNIVEQQSIFLAVGEKNINIIEEGDGTREPETDLAERVQ